MDNGKTIHLLADAVTALEKAYDFSDGTPGELIREAEAASYRALRSLCDGQFDRGSKDNSALNVLVAWLAEHDMTLPDDDTLVCLPANLLRNIMKEF